MPDYLSLQELNTSCSCENKSPKPPSSIEEERTLLPWNHATQSLWPCCYQLTGDNSWCAGSPLSCGSSEPILGHLCEFSGSWRGWIGKSGLTADEMWTWSTCWNENSLHSKTRRRIECCNDFFTSLSKQMHCKHLTKSLWVRIHQPLEASLSWKIKRPDSFQLIKWISQGTNCSCHLIRWCILIRCWLSSVEVSDFHSVLVGLCTLFRTQI